MLVCDDHGFGLSTLDNTGHCLLVFTAHLLVFYHIFDDLLVSQLDIQCVSEQSLKVSELCLQVVVSLFLLFELSLLFDE